MPRSRTTTAVLALAFALLLQQVEPAQHAGHAQQITPAGYRAHLMRHLQADQVAEHVRSAVGGRGQVLVDVGYNRLLVHGPDDVQQAAAMALAAADQPVGPAPAANGAVTQAYRIPVDRLDAAVAELRRNWPEGTGIRIVGNRNSSEILVTAPPSVHGQVALQLAELVQGGPIEAARQQQPVPTPVARMATGPHVRRNYRLRNVNWQQLEDEIRKAWGVQLHFDTQNNGELAIFRRLEILGGQALVTIDRRQNDVLVEGPQSETDAWVRAIQAMDVRQSEDAATQFVPVKRVSPQRVDQAISLIRTRTGESAQRSAPRARRAHWGGGELFAAIFQPALGDALAQAGGANQPAPGGGGEGTAILPGGGLPGLALVPQDSGFIGNVQIEYIEGLDIYIIRGRKVDVDRVVRIIQEIERLSVETLPVIEIVQLDHVNSEAMAAVMTQVYDQILSPRSGQVSITPLVKPNALLLIGREDAVQTVTGMIRRLDVPADPGKQMQVFQLRYMSAVDAEERINRFYGIPTTGGPPTIPPVGFATRVRVVADMRSNTIVVSASASDLKEIAIMLNGMDVSESYATQEIKVFRLRNTLAINVAPVLQDAINGQLPNAARSQLNQTAQATPVQSQPGVSVQASRALQFIHVDAQGGRLVKGTIMFDVKVVPDANTNSLIITAPAESMELIGKLVEQLDSLPSASAQIKVFTIRNGDATVMTAMLQQLFGQAVATGGAFAGLNQAALQNLVASGDNSLIQLRFAIDVRTNSVIATGSEGDLNLVEALLIRLDEDSVRKRKTTVYRLKNAPAVEIATAVNNFLAARQANTTALPNLYSPYDLVDREIIIEPEFITNSLIVSATPEYFENIRQVIEQLDARPPMVMIQVVIAEVALGDAFEFGVEFGIQDSLLFDRGLASAVPGDIRFRFNQALIGNDPDPASLATRENATGQLLSNLNVGRTSTAQGFGGLVLSVGNESVTALLRALEANNKMQILSRPQVMTLENQPAFVVVGQEIRLPAGISATTTSTLQGVDIRNVGIVLGVTPRTTPDGVVVMEIDAERSSLGADADGTTIGFSDTGEPIRVPPINLTTTQTTVRARTGQTVVLAGLITKQKSYAERGLPILMDIPYLGWLFRFTTDTEARTELLIIMTPYIIYEESDADWIKQIETERMNWSLEQVVEMHGDIGVGPGSRGDGAIPLIYPDLDPTGTESLPPGEDLQPNPTNPQIGPGGNALPQPMPADAANYMPQRGSSSPQMPQPTPVGWDSVPTPPVGWDSVPTLPDRRPNELRSSRRPDAASPTPAEAASAWYSQQPGAAGGGQFSQAGYWPAGEVRDGRSVPLESAFQPSQPSAPPAGLPQGGGDARSRPQRFVPWAPPNHPPRPLPPVE
jgi:type II secretion system protein D